MEEPRSKTETFNKSRMPQSLIGLGGQWDNPGFLLFSVSSFPPVPLLGQDHMEASQQMRPGKEVSSL